jgi:hypothetical protein
MSAAYFFIDSGDQLWSNASNWFNDVDATIPASVPGAGATVDYATGDSSTVQVIGQTLDSISCNLVLAVSGGSNLHNGTYAAYITDDGTNTFSGAAFYGNSISVNSGADACSFNGSYITLNNGTFSSCSFGGVGTTVSGYATVTGGCYFATDVYMSGGGGSGTIEGGTFDGGVTATTSTAIYDGTFNGAVNLTNGATIYGGTFNSSVTVITSSTVVGGIFYGPFFNTASVSGGTFYSPGFTQSGGTISGGAYYPTGTVAWSDFMPSPPVTDLTLTLPYLNVGFSTYTPSMTFTGLPSGSGSSIIASSLLGD